MAEKDTPSRAKPAADKPASAAPPAAADKPGSEPAAAPAAGGKQDPAPVVLDGPGPQFDTHPADVPVDPSTGEPFKAKVAGLKGRHGFEVVDQPGSVVQGVDPDRIPAELAPGVTPDAGGDQLLAAAQAKAPNLTREFVQAYGLGDDVLAQIARGEVPPPPTIGPVHTTDLYLTPGGWQQTPPGVPPADVGKNAIHR